jgi:glycosyltransferase involved in cell wall biosynthesis
VTAPRPAPLPVLVVAPWARRLGGAEEMLWELLRNCPRERVEFTVVFLEPGPFEREVADLGVETAVLEAGRLRSPLAVARTTIGIARAIRRRRPAVVLNWMAKTQLYGAPAAMLSGTGVRIAWWQHLTPHGHWMDRAATALPAAMVGASSEASAAAQRTLRPARRTVVIHPGIDEGSVPSAAVDRTQLGLSDAAVVLTLVGRLQPWKGQDRAIRAVRMLRDRDLDVQLLVVGGAAFGFDVDYEGELRDLAADLDIAPHVAFTGQVSSSRPYLDVTDIALNASESEPFGIVVLEAMAAEVAVVAVDAGGPAEILVHDETGRLARDGSPEALAETVEPLVRDAARRRRLAEAGRRSFEARFTARRMGERFADALEAVAA